MKVICIDGEWRTICGSRPLTQYPVFCETYTVIESFTDNDGQWYILEEFGPEDCFGQKAFIPLSNINEATFERNQLTRTQ